MEQNTVKRCIDSEMKNEDKAAADPFYSASNMERLERSIQKMERGEVVHKSLDELRGLGDE